MVFSGMKPSTFIGRHQSFGNKYCLHFICKNLLSWRRRRRFSSKCWYLSPDYMSSNARDLNFNPAVTTVCHWQTFN